jgi:hypothetical protein
MTLLGVVLTFHLCCAFSATALFWVAASVRKGGHVHRRAGGWFALGVYATAATGALLAISRLLGVGEAFLTPEQAASERHTTWLVLYVLLIIVTPVQHGLAVVEAGRSPMRVRSRVHAVCAALSMVSSLAILPAALLWTEWLYLIVAPIGFVVGLRNLVYASRPSATAVDVTREHLTSMLTAGITLHTALVVFSLSRTLGITLGGASALLPWTVPAVIGLGAILVFRARVAKAA